MSGSATVRAETAQEAAPEIAMRGYEKLGFTPTSATTLYFSVYNIRPAKERKRKPKKQK
jgi:hypothetical protein